MMCLSRSPTVLSASRSVSTSWRNSKSVESTLCFIPLLELPKFPTPQDLSSCCVSIPCRQPIRPEPLRKQSSIDDPRNSDLSPRSVDTLVLWEMAIFHKTSLASLFGTNPAWFFRITRPINQNLHISNPSREYHSWHQTAAYIEHCEPRLFF